MFLAQRAKSIGTIPATTPGSTARFTFSPYQRRATPSRKSAAPRANVASARCPKKDRERDEHEHGRKPTSARRRRSHS